MTKLKIFNYLLIIIAVIYGIFNGIELLNNKDIYGSLIRFSILPVMFVPHLIRKIFKVKVSVSIEAIYLLFIFVAHFLGSIVNFYHTIPNYDKLIHLISGIMSAFLGLFILVKVTNYEPKKLALNSLFIIGIVALVAISWEMFEFTCDNLFNKDAQNVLTTGINDTMQDMIAALIGSLLFIMMYIYESVNNKRWLITGVIKDINNN